MFQSAGAGNNNIPNNFSCSPQQLIDCSIISGNLGCAGGSLRNTLKYIQAAGGLMFENQYPYTGKVEDSC